ncbi:MAG: signal peptidase I [Nocardioides sp.]|nr:signal peptidase I [Nocardioides sp.]
MEIQAPRRRRSRVLLGRLVTAFSVVTTLLAVAFILPTALGLQRFVITGSSMQGTIDLGSVVFAEVVPTTDLEVGDVITYQPPPDSGIDTLVTHRIVSIEGGVFRTKGDNVPQVDPWTFLIAQPTQARVVFDVPYVGRLFIWLADRDTRQLFVGGPAALIALISVGQIITVLANRSRSRPETTAHGRSRAFPSAAPQA